MGEGRRVLNSFLQEKDKRFYIPLVGNQAFEIQRDYLQGRRPSAAASTSPEKCLVHLCCSPRAGLPGQLPRQLKSLQTGTRNGPLGLPPLPLPSSLLCLYVPETMLCSAGEKDTRMLTRESQQWHVNNTGWVHYDFMINRKQFEKLKFRIWSKVNHIMLV